MVTVKVHLQVYFANRTIHILSRTVNTNYTTKCAFSVWLQNICNRFTAVNIVCNIVTHYTKISKVIFNKEVQWNCVNWTICNNVIFRCICISCNICKAANSAVVQSEWPCWSRRSYSIFFCYEVPSSFSTCCWNYTLCRNHPAKALNSTSTILNCTHYCWPANQTSWTRRCCYCIWTRCVINFNRNIFISLCTCSIFCHNVNNLASVSISTTCHVDWTNDICVNFLSCNNWTAAAYISRKCNVNSSNWNFKRICWIHCNIFLNCKFKIKFTIVCSKICIT